MKKHKKLIIASLILIIAIAGLGYAGFMGSSTYYYEVGEFLDKGQALVGMKTRVSGEVNSVTTDSDFTLRFTLKDMTGRDDSIPVVYSGQVPNTFEAGRQVVVEGKIDQQGIFEASSIITKCSSKYEPIPAS